MKLAQFALTVALSAMLVFMSFELKKKNDLVNESIDQIAGWRALVAAKDSNFAVLSQIVAVQDSVIAQQKQNARLYRQLLGYGPN